MRTATLARGGLWLPGVVGAALVLGVAIPRIPPMAVAVVPLGALVAWLGIESLIVLAWLGAFGLLPFVDPKLALPGGLPLWLVAFAVACALMLGAWAAREVGGGRNLRMEPSALLVGTVALLGYSLARLVTGAPFAVPSLSLPFLTFPVSALVAFLWLSQPQALTGLRRTWPLVVVLLLAWCAMYVLGSAGGCGVCQHYVGSGLQSSNVLGGTTRLFTDGQNALLALLLVGVGLLLRRPTLLVGAFVAIGLLALGLQASRAQYGGILAGFVLLLAWRLRWSSPAARAAIVGLAVLALVALISSPVGARGLSAVSELQSNSGNGGYRLGLVAEQRQHYSLWGDAVDSSSLNGQINYDLGIPNTVVVLGWVGAGLQLLIVALAALRGLGARSLAGATIAAVALLLLVTRFSLPLLEGYSSAPAFGILLGFALALPGRRSTA